MSKLELVEDKLRDLLADCHEHGIPYIASIVDTESGDSINAIEASPEKIFIMIGILAARLHTKAGMPKKDVIEAVNMAIEAAIEVNQEIGE